MKCHLIFLKNNKVSFRMHFLSLHVYSLSASFALHLFPVPHTSRIQCFTFQMTIMLFHCFTICLNDLIVRLQKKLYSKDSSWFPASDWYLKARCQQLQVIFMLIFKEL